MKNNRSKIAIISKNFLYFREVFNKKSHIITVKVHFLTRDASNNLKSWVLRNENTSGSEDLWEVNWIFEGCKSNVKKREGRAYSSTHSLPKDAISNPNLIEGRKGKAIE